MKKDELKGIGGWLIIPTISFILIGIFSIIPLFTLYFSLIGGNDSLFIFVTIHALLVIFSAITLYLEFKYMKNFISWAIVILWVSAIGGIFLNRDFSFLVNMWVWAVIWTMYFLMSKRVKNTFVNEKK